jgi:chromosomal replication initiation ATPase DnaA
MYLAHTAFGLSISEIARECGRHRSTVAHACRVVEELRDDPVRDRALTALEAVLSTRRGNVGPSDVLGELA